MAPKRKLKQISNYDEKSNRSSKSNSNERKKNKRMKNTDTTVDPKVVKYQTEKKYFSYQVEGKKVINMCLIIVKLTTLKK